MTASKTIVFVHGAWVTYQCWDGFKAPFEAAGYTVHQPSWPLIEGMTAAEINAAPPPGFGSLGVNRIADHLQAYIEKLPEPPILIGHSFGGLLVQMLLDRGCGVAGVAIDPAPIGGVVPGPGAFAAITPIVARIAGWARPYALTRTRFGKLFANTAPAPLVDQAYGSYVIPAPGMIFHQAALWLGTWVNSHKRSQPLLITAGSKDRLVSPYLSRAAYNRQKKAKARTDIVAFEGRSHFLCAEPGWEEIAGAAIGWLREISVPQAAAQPVAQPVAAVPAMA